MPRAALDGEAAVAAMDVKVKSGAKTPLAGPAAARAARMANLPRGRNVSGRPWKRQPKQRTSAMRRPASAGASSKLKYELQLKQREAVKRGKESEDLLRETKLKILDEQKEKRLEAKRRRVENEYRSSSYQVINRTDKLKKMSKKQLRQIKKTRVNKDGQIEFVGAYEK